MDCPIYNGLCPAMPSKENWLALNCPPPQKKKMVPEMVPGAATDEIVPDPGPSLETSKL